MWNVVTFLLWCKDTFVLNRTTVDTSVINVPRLAAGWKWTNMYYRLRRNKKKFRSRFVNPIKTLISWLGTREFMIFPPHFLGYDKSIYRRKCRQI